MTPAELARVSREAQGLPPTITDPAALDRIAALLLVDQEIKAERAVPPPPKVNAAILRLRELHPDEESEEE